MFRSLRLPWLGVALVLVLVAGALGGVAIAQIDGGDEYTGCLNEGGSINKVAIGDEPLRPCPDDQTEISWNQTGPPGPSGLSQAFGTDNFGSPPLLEPGSVVDVATLELPAGNYVLNTDITIVEETPAEPPPLGGRVACRFVQEDGTEVGLPFGVAALASEGEEEWARSQPYPDHPGGDIVARCELDEGGTIRLYIVFNALAVDEVFIQHP